jgi:DNA-binding Xre family transcriptional regulator
MKIKENIKKLLESDITAYRISKETGISESQLSRMKKGEIEIGRITLDNAIKLNKFWEELKMKNFKNVGSWWNDKSIELVDIEGTVYALNGWNGEKYMNAWKCTGEDYMDASEEEYIITPVYSDEENEHGVYEIVGYEVE